MKLKIFADKQYFSPNAPLVPLLYPFWGIPATSHDHLWNSTITIPALDRFMHTASSCFEIVSLQEADCVVLPNDLEFFATEEVKVKSNALIAAARNFSKPVMAFFSGDCSHLPVPFDIDFSLRDSLYRSTRQLHEFSMPTWIEDLIQVYSNGQVLSRKKQAKPVISFCGYAAPRNFKTFVKVTLYYLKQAFPDRSHAIPPYYTGHVIRSLALSRLSKSSLVDTSFVIRSQAGLIGGAGNQAQDYRSRFVQNILDADYVLCCRGSGNHSNRLYETLCCGRIPILIDTDCVLPLEFDINWQDYCVYVKENEISAIDQKVAEFHAKLSPTRFVELQHECRKLWKTKLSPEGFFSNLYRHYEVVVNPA